MWNIAIYGKRAFWARVEICKHKHTTGYYSTGMCDTPYCGGWIECHCRDCGVYFTECRCGCSDGLSGWSYKRRISYNIKYKKKVNRAYI